MLPRMQQHTGLKVKLKFPFSKKSETSQAEANNVSKPLKRKRPEDSSGHHNPTQQSSFARPPPHRPAGPGGSSNRRTQSPSGHPPSPSTRPSGSLRSATEPLSRQRSRIPAVVLSEGCKSRSCNRATGLRGLRALLTPVVGPLPLPSLPKAAPTQQQTTSVTGAAASWALSARSWWSSAPLVACSSQTRGQWRSTASQKASPRRLSESGGWLISTVSAPKCAGDSRRHIPDKALTLAKLSLSLVYDRAAGLVPAARGCERQLKPT